MIQWCKWKEKVWRGQLRLPWTCYLLWKICLGSQNCQFHVKGIFSHIRWATGLKKKLCDSNINLSVDFFFSSFFPQGIKFFKQIKRVLTKKSKILPQQFNKIQAALGCLRHNLSLFFLHPNCILLYQNESSAVTPLGSKLLWGSVLNVDGLENNTIVTHHRGSE